jgi:hypothetical protein
MSLLNDLFNSGKNKEALTSLDLKIPARPLPSLNSDQPTAASVTPCQVVPEWLKAMTPEITRRAKEMLAAGMKPMALYLAVTQTGQLIHIPNGDHMTLLMFTSGFAAMDYLKYLGLSGGVHEFMFESLPKYIGGARRAGTHSFVLDRCPRCPQYAAVLINEQTEEQFLSFWAFHRATRNLLVERRIRAYFDWSRMATELPELVDPEKMKAHRRATRAHLEYVRDHFDCSVPFLHWKIALDAAANGDEEARAYAVQRLEEFGPDFKDKVPRIDGTHGTLTSDEFLKQTVDSALTAHLGLLGAYGMLSPELQSAVKFEEIRSTPPQPTQ